MILKGDARNVAAVSPFEERIMFEETKNPEAGTRETNSQTNPSNHLRSAQRQATVNTSENSVGSLGGLAEKINKGFQEYERLDGELRKIGFEALQRAVDVGNDLLIAKKAVQHLSGIRGWKTTPPLKIGQRRIG